MTVENILESKRVKNISRWYFSGGIIVVYLKWYATASVFGFLIMLPAGIEKTLPTKDILMILFGINAFTCLLPAMLSIALKKEIEAENNELT